MKALILVLGLVCTAAAKPTPEQEYHYLQSKLGEKLVFVGKAISNEKHGAVLAVTEIYQEALRNDSDPFSPDSTVKRHRFQFDGRWFGLAELREWPKEYRDEKIVVRGVLKRGTDWPVKVVAKEKWPETEKEFMDLGAIPAETEQEAEVEAANFIIGSYRWRIADSVEPDGYTTRD